MRNGYRVVDVDSHVTPSMEVLNKFAGTEIKSRWNEFSPYFRTMNSPLGRGHPESPWTTIKINPIPYDRIAGQPEVAEKVKKVSKNRPLLNYGKAREDLRYYLDLPVKDVFGGSAFQELISQPETMMIIKKSHSKAWLEKSSDLKIIVEMDLSFEPYQLVGKP